MEENKNFLAKLDPRTKLLILLILNITALIMPTFIVLGTVTFFLLFICMIGKCLDKLFKLKILILSAFFFSILTWSLLFGSDNAKILSVFSIDGIMYGLNLFLKLFIMIIAGTILMGTTKNEELFLSMIKMKVSYKVAFAFSFALRIVPLILKEYKMILEAQTVRGLDLNHGGIIKKFKQYIPVLIPAILLTIRNTGEFADTLETKGFGVYNTRSSYREIKFKLYDYITCITMIFIFLIILFFKLFSFT